MNEIIPHIKDAIKACKKQESAMIAEKENLFPALKGAHYLNANTLHLIERQYNEKIENVHDEIDGMEKHVKELEENV